MKARTQILVAGVVAPFIAALTALLLLSGYVGVAVWLYGPYFLLSRLLPGSIDTLTTLVVAVAAYYFALSLVALRCSSRRTLIVVVSIAIILNTLGFYVFHRISEGG